MILLFFFFSKPLVLNSSFLNFLNFCVAGNALPGLRLQQNMWTLCFLLNLFISICLNFWSRFTLILSLYIFLDYLLHKAVIILHRTSVFFRAKQIDNQRRVFKVSHRCCKESNTHNICLELFKGALKVE